MNKREIYYAAMKAKRAISDGISRSLREWREIRATQRHQAMRSLEHGSSFDVVRAAREKIIPRAVVRSSSDSMSRTERNSRARDNDRRR